MLGEVFAGTGIAGLHFVQHEQPVVLVAYFLQSVEVAGVGDGEATLAEDWLDEYGHHVRVIVRDLFNGFDIVIRCAHES